MGPQGSAGPTGAVGPEGQRGEPGPSDLLFWGSFSGLSPGTVFETGGQADLISFVRVARGVYRLTLDYPRDASGGVAILATATGFALGTNVSAVGVINTNIDFAAAGDRLVIEIVSVNIINNPISGFVLFSNDDWLFSLSVFDDDI